METEFESWNEEKQSAYLYRILAECEPAPEFRALFTRLGEAAEEQSKHWEKLAAGKQVKLPAGYQPDMRTRLVAHMLQRLGPRRMLPVWPSKRWRCATSTKWIAY